MSTFDIEAELPDLPPRTAAMDDTPNFGADNGKTAVREFVKAFRKHLIAGNTEELYQFYENYYNQITEIHFRERPWPTAEEIQDSFQDNVAVEILYRELYYRHIYSKLAPTLQHRVDSWDNYCDLFNFFLQASNAVTLELPNQWLWDIIDEFIYQFQSFSYYKLMLKNKSPEEIAYFKDAEQVWNVKTVISYLLSLITKSNIIGWLERKRAGEEVPEESVEIPGDFDPSTYDYSQRMVYKMLGYFSIIGLLRVHCMLGDYNLAVKTLEPIEFSDKKALYTRVIPCYISLYYYLGFAYMMMRRYIDAVRTFGNILLYISRTKQYFTRSYQYDVIIKKSEQMYALLAICLSLNPFPQRVDESIMSVLRDRYADELSQMQQGGGETAQAFEKLFTFACPKFLSPAVPDFNAAENLHLEATQLQLQRFLREVKQQAMVPVLRSYLKLYTTISLQKLADFLQTDVPTVRSHLMCLKHKMRQLVWESGAPAEGVPASATADINFYIDDQDTLHVADVQVSRRHGEYFTRNIEQFQNLITALQDPALHYLGVSMKHPRGRAGNPTDLVA